MQTTGKLAAAGLGMTVGLMAAACAIGPSAAPRSSTTSRQPTATTSPSTTTSTTTTTQPSTTTTAVAAANCTTAQLKVTAGHSIVGLGHIGVPLLFQNTSPTTCLLHDYPGVAGLDDRGNQVTQANRTPVGYLGGLFGYGGGPFPNVTLGKGAVASALVEGTDVPTGGATSCTTYVALLVIPPNTAQSVRLNAQLPGCSGLEVHPVVPGPTGSGPQ